MKLGLQSKRASRLQEKIRHQVRFEPAFEESVLVEVGSVGGVPLLRTKPSDRQPLDHDKARPGGQEFRLNHLIVESVLFRRDRFRSVLRAFDRTGTRRISQHKHERCQEQVGERQGHAHTRENSL